jgi:DNA (cytosine-5)-methyltransferase 1
MPDRPRILDLFCGAGGAAEGYRRAGFDVLGVDIKPQPNYPFEFIQADAIEFLERMVAGGTFEWKGPGLFAAVHASPPCQRFSAMSSCRPGLAADYEDLIAPTRDLLMAWGIPYVIENVPGAPLINAVMLCGQMFDLDLYRHRFFEASFPIQRLLHPLAPIAHARRIMGIDWMTREELAEAIPPAYTEFIGAQLVSAINAKVAA